MEDAQGRRAAQRPEELRAGVEANLQSLSVDCVDVVNLRRMDSPSGLRAEGEQLVDLDSQLAELVALRDEGKIGAIGLSTVTADQVHSALPAGLVCVQNPYSLLHRADELVLELCRQHDIAWVPYFPLGSAFAGIPKVAEAPAVIEAAQRIGANPAQVGLSWLLHHAANVLLIPGTSSLEHLKENIAAASLRLGDEIIDSLDAVAIPAT